MPSFPKIFGSPGLIILSFLIVLSIVYFLYVFYHLKEGFSGYPVNEERINYEEAGKRRYNDYADTIDVLHENIIPNGSKSDPILKNLLITPAVEGKTKSETMSGLNYNDPLKYLVPELSESILKKIRTCEAVKSWDCNAFEDPEFSSYCGICTSGGEDHKGNKHIGGLYIDQQLKDLENQRALSAGEKPKYSATAGFCKGEFLLGRPYCDIQKDRYECSKETGFDGEAAKTKCSLCAYSPGGSLFVYTGNRSNADMNYKLIGNRTPFPVRLRLAVANLTDVSIKITRKSDSKVYPGSFIANTNIFIADIPKCAENELFNIKVFYPEYDPYNWSKDDVSRLSGLMKPASAPLMRAAYGPYNENFMQDDPRTVDVSNFLKATYKMNDCSKTEVTVSNDALGGDPAPGVQKQLRLVYGENGSDFAYAYGAEGEKTKVVNTGTFSGLCPDPVPRSEAERTVCETDVEGNPYEQRTYTQGRNQNFVGVEKTNSVCIVQRPPQNYAISGVIESAGRSQRQVPLDISVSRIDGYDVGEDGVKTLGTLKGSKTIKSVSIAKLPGVPPSLFWFWSKNNKNASIDIDFLVPATLKDPTIQEDIKLCPSGPLITTKEAARRLNSGACESLVEGKPQGPGTYTDNCLRSLFLASGCTKNGHMFPNNSEKAKVLSKDPYSNQDISSDDILENIEEINIIAKSGSTKQGLKVEKATYEKANLDCFGLLVSNPCETVYKETGPHSAECLDYLFKDAGKMNPAIGSTYRGVSNRSSGTDRTEKTPIMYCQRSGILSPIGVDGKTNEDAMKIANSYGSLRAVKEFYSKVHRDANYSSDPIEQKRALKQCYGVGVKDDVPICKGTKARYVRVRPTLLNTNNSIQISHIDVFNTANKNVSKSKTTKSSKSIGAPASVAVNGISTVNVFPNLFVSENDSSQSRSEKYWEVDLGKTEEISYIDYKNTVAGRGLPLNRSTGMRIQLVGEDGSVVREELLKGDGETETIMFSDAKKSQMFKIGDNISFIPGKYSGSALSTEAGGELLIKPLVSTSPATRLFSVVSPNFPNSKSFSFKLLNSEKYLRVQGFRLRLAADDGSTAFKKETTFSVTDSNAGSPGEVSYESVAMPEAFIAVSQNMGAYVSKVNDENQKRASSWQVKVE